MSNNIYFITRESFTYNDISLYYIENETIYFLGYHYDLNKFPLEIKFFIKFCNLINEYIEINENLLSGFTLKIDKVSDRFIIKDNQIYDRQYKKFINIIKPENK